MAKKAVFPPKGHARVGIVLIFAGLISVIAGATYGYISIGSVGTGELDNAPLGTQLTFKAAGSHRANIFTGGEQPAQCEVITSDGRDVPLGEARPYSVNQEYQMQSTYGFDVSQGTTYLVTCSSHGDGREFAVVEVPIGPERVAIALGSLGAVVFAVGLVLAIIGRRDSQSGQEGRSLWRRIIRWPSTRLGWWSVGLAATYVVLFIINSTVFMPSIVEVPWRQTVLPFYGIFMMLCGFAAGIVGLIAVIWRHERSWLVWLTILPGLFVLVFVLGVFLVPSPAGQVEPQVAAASPIATTARTVTDQGTPASPAYTPTVLPALEANRIRVIFDDDGSPDGTTALFYLLGHPEVSVEAIGISYGEAYPEVYIQHIGRKLDQLGIHDIPLGAGEDAPLAGSNEFPEWLRQSAGNFWGLPIPNADKTYPTQDASELMVSIINQTAPPVTILVSGPCTNLAQALRLDPGIKDGIATVYIMGGAVYAPGNIDDLLPDPNNTVAEWNIYADPQAAKEVFESGLDIYLVPLDATNQVMISRQDTRQWRLGGGTANFAADIYDMLLNSWGAENAAIWDLMTAAIMVKPDLCGFQPLHLEIITEEGTTIGQTVVVPDEEPNTYVCLDPNVDLIKQTLIDAFSSSR